MTTSIIELTEKDIATLMRKKALKFYKTNENKTGLDCLELKLKKQKEVDA